MRILLLCSAFNGLSQRAWLELRAAGHDVTVELATTDRAMTEAVGLFEPDLIICPFLRHRVPVEVWGRYRTIILHPGPKGDRGPSSLDWAITTGETRWGVTALQAVEEMDAGPIWATRTVRLPTTSRKSTIYNGPIADAAIELIGEVVAKATDPSFTPEPLDYRQPDVIGRLRPGMRAVDRQFSWHDPTETILRCIRAADGSPGVRTTLGDQPVSVFDAHPGPSVGGPPGTIAIRHHDAVLVRTGDGAVWIGQVRPQGAPGKLPATVALGRHLRQAPELLQPVGGPVEASGRREISYQRQGPVGIVTFDFYNGAMSTAQCQRLLAALSHATSQSTKVLVIRGGESFSNGIHLNVIEAASSPALEAWRNINAIDDVCRQIITGTSQLVITSVAGNAGAGGVMLALGADRVILRDGVVLNPHYQTMGLRGSEYWTYLLPRRVGPSQAATLTGDCLPIDAGHANRIGLADVVLPGRPAEFEHAVIDYARQLASRADYSQLLERKSRARGADEHRKSLDAYRAEELAEMSRDIFDDRNGFSESRHAFVTKRAPTSTPARLARHHTTVRSTRDDLARLVS